jgi:glycosyltransferase involved in cell wall biosynthesis
VTHVNSPAQITTVIPTFRRPQKVERAIRSVLAQSYPNFEVHIYDNASGDATRDVVGAIAAMDHRVKYFCQPENIGFVKNFSCGMQMARTPFVNLLSDDDLLLPNFFADATASFDRHPQAFLFVGLVSERHGDGTPYPPPRKLVKPGMYNPPLGFGALMSEAVPRTWTGMLFRRAVFEQIGTLDGALTTQHDHEFVIRTALRWPVVFETIPCGAFFHHDDSIHMSTSRTDCLLGWGQILRKVESDASLPGAVRRRAVRCIKKRLRRDVIRSAVLSSLNGQFQDAAEVAALLEREVDSKWSARALSLLVRHGAVGGSFRLMARSSVHVNRKMRAIKDYVMFSNS